MMQTIATAFRVNSSSTKMARRAADHHLLLRISPSLHPPDRPRHPPRTKNPSCSPDRACLHARLVQFRKALQGSKSAPVTSPGHPERATNHLERSPHTRQQGRQGLVLRLAPSCPPSQSGSSPASSPQYQHTIMPTCPKRFVFCIISNLWSASPSRCIVINLSKSRVCNGSLTMEAHYLPMLLDNTTTWQE